MPIMQVQYPAGALDGPRKSDLAGRLTEVLLDMEGGARTEGGRAFAWVLFSEFGPGDWWVGGKSDGSHVAPPGAFLVRVTVPEGYMNAANKSAVHASVNAAVLAATGPAASPRAGASVLVIIEEVTEGNWGARGESISLARIADTVGLPKDGQRFAWVRSYFSAKARLRAAFDYPADSGGLLPADGQAAEQHPHVAEARAPCDHSA
jgi:phenylpyruvate tautomerase PptA (4-oxalocrotonate tautomerase family)